MHLGHKRFRGFTKERDILLAFVLLSSLTRGAVVPANTSLEVRLSDPSGSRISHVGDPVNATVIAPVFDNGHLLIPQGTSITGDVEEVERLGYGLKRVNSEMRYRFNRLQLPDGTTVAIEAEVAQVETAKERVNTDGLVGGIYPTVNVSSSLASYVIPMLWIAPHFGVPFLGIKVVIARSPDPEIYFPAGTEFILRLTADATVPSRGASAEGAYGSTVPELSTRDRADVHRILAKLPEQRSNRGRNHPSDLVNLLILGNREAVDRAFHAAGWAGAQRSSLLSIYRMYRCMVQRIGYSTAPMGSLTLNGLRADAEYQKSLNTFSKRHHVRLWKQGGDGAWLSAATEDTNYGFRHMHLTHVTDPRIDNERNKVVNDVAFTGCLEAAALVTRAQSEEPESSIQTDGKIAVLRVNDCEHPQNGAEVYRAPGLERPRYIQALYAMRNDLIRTNPVFLTFNTARLLCNRWEARGSGSRMALRPRQQKAGASETNVQSGWVQSNWMRPSVLGAEASLKLARVHATEHAAEHVPEQGPPSSSTR